MKFKPAFDSIIINLESFTTFKGRSPIPRPIIVQELFLDTRCNEAALTLFLLLLFRPGLHTSIIGRKREYPQQFEWEIML